ncbi:hypothetical protein [Acinetobacter baumannii]|uniref:hypothetical protein n=1 Tax=Acinetobacter baumannii TaxID=470 RepID=UPI001BB166BB|nr:hypothetical protein [Acinetobacter baumannii]
MTTRNHIHILKQYDEYEQTIHSLIDSMMTSLNTTALLYDREAQQQVINNLNYSYPFVELIYSLDSLGIQLMDSVYSPTVSDRKRRSFNKGSDRSKRPYVIVACEQFNRVVVTQPYLSTATHQLSISGVQHLNDEDGRPRLFGD